MKNTSDFERRIGNSIEASIAAKKTMLSDSQFVATVAKVSEILVEALKQANKALLFGNGGSAADAQHIAAELVGRFAFDRPALPALALSVNTSCVTAIGNDYGFDQVFSRQIEALARRGDVAIGISTSGNSSNVLHAVSTARKMGLHTTNESPRIQECHILIGHIISELVEREISPEEGRVSGS